METQFPLGLDSCEPNQPRKEENSNVDENESFTQHLNFYRSWCEPVYILGGLILISLTRDCDHPDSLEVLWPALRTSSRRDWVHSDLQDLLSVSHRSPLNSRTS